MISNVLRYGSGGSLRIEVAEESLIAACGTPKEQPVENLAAAVRQALADPLEYPPLVEGTVPGDRVLIALEDGVPRAPTVVAAIIGTLLDGRVAADGITVLHTQGDQAIGGDPLSELPELLREAIAVEEHDPANRDRLAMLTSFEDGEPVLLNRSIVDADLVLPVGSVSSRRIAGYHGIHGAVFPAFSDAKTIARFRSPDVLRRDTGQKKRLVKQCDEVGWLLGVNFTIQIVPGAGDGVLRVVAGQVDAVRSAGRELYETAWGCTVPRRARLVVAAIEGGPFQQTWQNVAQAVATAGPLVEDDGAIAVCSALNAEPGPAVQRLSSSRSAADIRREQNGQTPSDAIAALQLAHALRRGHVYLLSELDASLVEDLGLAPLDEPNDVARLARRSPSCILLANAGHVMVRIE